MPRKSAPDARSLERSADAEQHAWTSLQTPARKQRSTRNQHALYSAKLHPMDVVTRPRSAQKLRASQLSITTPPPPHGSSQLKPSAKRKQPERVGHQAALTAALRRDLYTTPSPSTRKSSRKVAKAQEGVYNAKYHPMDAELRPARAAKILPPSSSNATTKEAQRVTQEAKRRASRSAGAIRPEKRRRSLSLDMDAPVLLHGKSQIAVGDGESSVGTVLENEIDSNHERGSSSPRASSSDDLAGPGLPPSTSTVSRKTPKQESLQSVSLIGISPPLPPRSHVSVSSFEPRQSTPLAHDEPDLLQSELTSQFFDFESYEADQASCAPVTPTSTDDGYEADTELSRRGRRRRAKSKTPSKTGVSENDSDTSGVVYDCITALEFAVPPDNPWLQEPKNLFRHMTKLDKRLYNLQHGQPDDENVLPLTWKEAVESLVHKARLMTFEDFERWGGMPALRGRYEILRRVVQGKAIYTVGEAQCEDFGERFV